MSYPDATPEPVAFGERVRILRTHRGMSRPVLAGLLGKSPSWLKQVERGDIHTPALPVILRIAEALRVRDLSDLVGDQSVSVRLFIGRGHARLPSTRSPSPRTARPRTPRTCARASPAPGQRATGRPTTATSSATCCPN